MIEPKPPTGSSAFAVWCKKLLEWIRSSLIISGPGYRLERGPRGTVLKLYPAAAGGTTAGGMNFRGPWSLDARFNRNDIVYVDDFQFTNPDGTVTDTEGPGVVANRRWFFIWLGENNTNSPTPPGMWDVLPEKFNLADSWSTNLMTPGYGLGGTGTWMFLSVIFFPFNRGVSGYARYTAADGSQRFMTFQNGLLLGDEAGFPVGG
jgi:hypothetical protein